MTSLSNMSSTRSLAKMANLQETFYCEFCLDRHPVEGSVVLETCGHRFCNDMFGPWVVSKIDAGQIHPRCFHTLRQDDKCNALILEHQLLEHLPAKTVAKYNRFKAQEEE